jgi:hypothetical protein
MGNCVNCARRQKNKSAEAAETKLLTLEVVRHATLLEDLSCIFPACIWHIIRQYKGAELCSVAQFNSNITCLRKFCDGLLVGFENGMIAQIRALDFVQEWKVQAHRGKVIDICPVGGDEKSFGSIGDDVTVRKWRVELTKKRNRVQVDTEWSIRTGSRPMKLCLRNVTLRSQTSPFAFAVLIGGQIHLLGKKPTKKQCNIVQTRRATKKDDELFFNGPFHRAGILVDAPRSVSVGYRSFNNEFFCQFTSYRLTVEMWSDCHVCVFQRFLCTAQGSAIKRYI